MRRTTKHRQQATVEQLESLLLLSPLQGGTPNYFGPEPNWAYSPQPTTEVSIGNPLIARTYATDLAAQSLAINTSHPLPTGTLTDFQIFDQPGSGPNFFHAYVMRPAGAGSYNVVFDSGAQLMPSTSMGQVLDFPLPAPVSVHQGDVIAHYGQGIPLAIGGGADTYVLGDAAPANGQTITPAVYGTNRTYSIDAVVTPTATAGNPLTPRAYSTDGDPASLAIDTSHPLPAGTLTTFETFVQPGSGPYVFHAYVMHPTSPGTYTVAYDSGALSVPSLTTGQVVSFPVGPFTVQAGDLIAHYGQGVPLDIGGGTDTYVEGGVAPTAGQTITPTVFTTNRTYSIAATVDTGAFTGGIRKFVDSLPGLGANNANDLGQYLPVAVPDQTTYPGSDYYEIGLVQYTAKMSSDLNPTTLQGYVQIETPQNTAVSHHIPLTYLDGKPILNLAGQQVYSVDPPSYLGPEIVATKDVPVRVKFTNYLPTGQAGDLFLPVDTTSMGAGAGPNMIMPMHTHYNGTPTVTVHAMAPHSLSVGSKVILSGFEPAAYNGEFRVVAVTSPVSFQVTLNSDPGTAATTLGTVAEAYTDNRATIHLHGGDTVWISDGTQNQWITPAGETTNYPKGVSAMNVPDMPDPGPGSATFFYSNQQSARLMFYHDHAMGITRLNVYSGEAAGYLLTDSVEQSLIASGILPGIGTPLIIQDKTFVDPKTVLTTDPTWMLPVNPANNDLWVPHVYMTNQNPNSPDGGNAQGRWDYGPWFWPPWPTSQAPFQGVGDLTLTDPGSGYTLPPVVTITPPPAPPGSGATATAAISAGAVTAITVRTQGTLYALPPTVTITPAPGDTTGSHANAVATIDATGAVTAITVQNPGMNYTLPPIVTITPKAGTAATAVATIDGNGAVVGLEVTSRGTGYTQAPIVTITPAPGDTTGTGATATAPNWWLPNLPDNSQTMEAFNDTPVVNGTAYPFMNVDAKPYRFRILNAANDRMWNLQLYTTTSIIDSIAVTDGGSGYDPANPPRVIITPAQSDTQGMGATAVAVLDPDTGAITAINMITVGSGYTLPPIVSFDAPPSGGTPAHATASLYSGDSEVGMVPALPGAAQFPASWQGQTLTNSTFTYDILNGRDGGVPDPRNMGPTMVQIGNEGGFLPSPVELANTPVGYETNPKNIVITNVKEHTLLLGPAERADVIIDFSDPKFRGKTIVLYNDAPAALPAADSRVDYFTSNADQTASGGNVTTRPGFGPDTRTIMVFHVSNSGVVSSFNMNALKSAFSEGATATASISTSGSTKGQVKAIKVDLGGSGYTVAPKVTITPAPGDLTGAGATATAVIDLTTGVVTGITVTNGGRNYTAPPTITLSSMNATALATLTDGTVTGLTVTNGGSGYTTPPTVLITPAYGDTTGTGATATAVLTNGVVTGFTNVTPGGGYKLTPIVAIEPAHQSVFEADQNPIIVPQAAYNSAYGANFPATAATGAYGKIDSTSLTFNPLDLTSSSKVAASPVTIKFQPKAIQELFDNITGRMQAELGVELKFTNGGNQTTIPYTVQDPVTEILNDTPNVAMTPIGVLGDGTQIWKITHNGVDTHPIHFHLFNVQVLNRVGWDGQIRLPDANELGWKETVRMSPLEDVIIAMRPVSAKVPFGVPDSFHLLDPTMPKDSTMGFAGIDPQGNPVTVTNQYYNFGWEYVWHCHILSHEEMAMMRPMQFNFTTVAPAAPVMASLAMAANAMGQNQAVLGWTDPTPGGSPSTLGNPANEIGFWIERAPLVNGVVDPAQYTKIGTAIANATTYADATIVAGQAYSYRVASYNVSTATYNADGTVTYAPVYSNPWYFVPPVSVSSQTPSGAYNAGSVISIDVLMADPVIVSGSPTLLLNNAAAAVFDPSSSKGNHLVFSYTVQPGQDWPRLDYAGTDAISLGLPGGAQIQTLAGNPAVLTLPPPGSAADGLFTNNIMIDTTAPAISYAVAPAVPDGANGWFITAPTVTFTATDPATPPPSGSGIKSVTAPVTLGSGGGQTVTGTAVDNAGNTASITTAPINVDLVTPSATLSFSGTAGNNSWYVGYGNVTLLVSAGASGATTTYTINDGASQPYNDAFPLNTDGTYNIAWTVTNGAGVSSLPASAMVQIDTAKPVTTATLSGTQGLNSWYTTSVTVGLSATDIGGSGPASTSFKVDSGATQAYTVPFTVTGDGTHTVTYFSTDVAGNVEVANTATIKIDTTTPSATASFSGTPGNTPWYVSYGNVTLVPVAGPSGVTTTYTVDGAQPPLTYAAPFPISTDGTHTIAWTVTNGAGASSTDSFTIKIDTTKPVVSGVANLTTGPTDSSGSTVTYSVTASDATSPPPTLVFKLTDGTPVPSGYHYTPSATPYTVNYTATDQAGNAATGSFTVTVNPVGFIVNQLYVVGTSASDTIAINATNLTAVAVTEFGKSYSPFSLAGGKTIAAYGNGGGDTITVSGAPAAIVTDSGTLANTFDVSNWTGTGQLVGGGNDVVAALKNATITLTNTSLVSGTLNLGLSGITTANLASTTGNRTMNVSGWTGGGKLTVSGGTDTLLATKDADYTLIGSAAAGTLTATDGLNMTFTGAVTPNMTAITNSHGFTVDGWTGAGRLAGTQPTGGGKTFTVNATKNVAAFTLANGSLQAGDGMNVTLAGVNAANLTGGATATTFTVSTWTAGPASLTGKSGTDTVASTRSTNLTLSDTQLVYGTQVVSLSGIGTANLSSTSGNRSMTVSGWTGQGTLSVTGTTGTLGTIVASKDADMTLSYTALTSPGGPNLTLAGFNRSTLTAATTAAANPRRSINAAQFTGNSTLSVSGPGNAILVGGTGNDTLSNTGSGFAVLIGGLGADRLSSTGSGQTMMIGGSTKWDNPTGSGNVQALDAILGAWETLKSDGSNYGSVTQGILDGTLTGGLALTGGINGTVQNDNNNDTMTGPTTGTIPRNWFIGKTSDTITKRSAEKRTNL